MRYQAEFTPVSGLVFRDARPFDAGTDSVSSNLEFPPPPEAFWSALKRVLISVRSRSLRVHGFYLKDDVGPLLPAMADLIAVRPVDDPWAGETLSLLQPLQHVRGSHSDLAPVWLADRNRRARPCQDDYLRPESFLLYLTGNVGAPNLRDHLIRSTFLFKEESRTGVELAGRNAREGRLYTSRVVFLEANHDLRFCLDFEIGSQLPDRFPTDHIVHLGGEGKLARLRITRPYDSAAGVLPERARECVRGAVEKARNDQGTFRVKLCLLTPAVFSARKELLQRSGTQTPAWRPFWMDNSQNGWCRPIFNDQSYQLRLVAAAAPKAFPLGAWDRASHTPRPLHRCQPAGTVYFLELTPVNEAGAVQALDQFFNDFWLGTLLVKVLPSNPAAVPAYNRGLMKRTRETVSPLGLRGFGWTVIGAWNYA